MSCVPVYDYLLLFLLVSGRQLSAIPLSGIPVSGNLEPCVSVSGLCVLYLRLV